MTFNQLAQYLQRLEETSSRIEITKILAELFASTDAGEIDKIVYLSLGRLAPAYESIVFNLADKLVLQSISKAYGKTLEEVTKSYKQHGDIGEVAQRQSERVKEYESRGLSIAEVYDQLVNVAKYEGEGSVEKKVDSLSAILSKLDSLSVRYLARIPVGKLRLGFSELTVLDALSWMENGDKSGSKMLKRAYEVMPDIGLLAKKVKQDGIKKTSKSISPVLGIPVMPMLAQRIKSPSEMIEKMGKVAVEPKYDGLRVLIHYKRGKWIKAFTRNLNDISDMFPELEKLSEATKSNELILDAEAVGVDEETKKMADFQTTMTRRRKHDIADLASKIPLTFNVFDILFVDGKNLVDDSYSSRRLTLKKILKETKTFHLTEFVLTDDPAVIVSEYDRYIDQGLEGVIVKKADSIYVPGRTGYRWVKMKQSEGASGKLSDTVDCVVMGYTQGKGKRTSFGIGQFLAGVIDGEQIKTVTKVGTGLSDKDFKELYKRLSKIKVNEKPKEYEAHKDLEPDFWVSPEVVVELAADDLTKSPKHTAGYALRFPRLVKFRDDKSAKEATTVKEVQKLYKLQFK